MEQDERESMQTSGEEKDQAVSPTEEEVSSEQTLQKEYTQLKEDLLRAMAEAENIRKRTQKEKIDALKYAISSFGKDLVNVAENLRRAIENIPPSSAEGVPDSVKAFIEGVRLTEKELLSVFEKNGIKQILPLGEKFDHNCHQAMFEVEDDSKPAGTVIQVMEGGYMLHDRLLKPAFVGVSKMSGKKESS